MNNGMTEFSPEQLGQLQEKIEKLDNFPKTADGRVDMGALSAEQTVFINDLSDSLQPFLEDVYAGLAELAFYDPDGVRDAVEKARAEGTMDFDKLSTYLGKIEAASMLNLPEVEKNQQDAEVVSDKSAAAEVFGKAEGMGDQFAEERAKLYKQIEHDICPGKIEKATEIGDRLCKVYENDFSKINNTVAFAANIDPKSIHVDSKEQTLERRVEYDVAKNRFENIKDKYHFQNSFVIYSRIAMNVKAYRAGMHGATGKYIAGGQIAIDIYQLLRSNPVNALFEIAFRFVIDAIFPVREAQVDVSEKDALADSKPTENSHHENVDQQDKPDSTILENGTIAQGVDRKTYTDEVKVARDNGSTTAGYVAGVDVSKEPRTVKGVDIWRSGKPDEVAVVVNGRAETISIEKERVACIGGNYYLVGPDGFGRVTAVNSPATLIDADDKGRCYIKQCDTFSSKEMSEKIEAYAKQQGVSKEDAVASFVSRSEAAYISATKGNIEKTISSLSNSIDGKKETVAGYKEQLEKIKAHNIEGKFDKAIEKLEVSITKTEAAISKMEDTLSRFEKAKETFDKPDASFTDKVDALAKAEEKASQADTWHNLLDKDDKTVIGDALQEVDKAEEDPKDAVSKENKEEAEISTDNLIKNIEDKTTALSEKESELKTALEAENNARADRAEAEVGSKTERKEAEETLQGAKDKVEALKTEVDQLKNDLKNAIDTFAGKHTENPDVLKFCNDLKNSVDNSDGKISASKSFLELTERNEQFGITTIRSFDKGNEKVEITTVNSCGDVESGKPDKLTPAAVDAIGKASIPESPTKEVGFLDTLKKYEPTKENMAVVADYLKASGFDTKEKIGAVKDFCEWAHIDSPEYDKDTIDAFDEDNPDFDRDDVEASINDFLDYCMPDIENKSTTDNVSIETED